MHCEYIGCPATPGTLFEYVSHLETDRELDGPAIDRHLLDCFGQTRASIPYADPFVEYCATLDATASIAANRLFVRAIIAGYVLGRDNARPWRGTTRPMLVLQDWKTGEIVYAAGSLNGIGIWLDSRQ